MQFSSKIFLETHMLPLLRLQQRVDEIALDFVTKEGIKLPTLANATERRDAAGQLLSTRLILLKAVDRRTYEREQFIAVLGHDLRNPLASIDSGVRILEKEALTERASFVLRLMQGSVARASGLIDNVLDFCARSARRRGDAGARG